MEEEERSFLGGARMSKDDEKVKKVANLTTFMLSQDYLPEHWNWDAQEKNVIATYANTPDATREVGRVVFNRLIGDGLDVVEAYAITHNKDEHEIWSDYQNKYITSFTSHHIHFVAKLKVGVPLEKIAEIIGVEPNFIEKPQRGRYSYDNMLSYLIHIKYPSKYRYGAREVVTFCGKDYFDYYSENHKQWMHGRAERIIIESKITLHDVEMLIMDGKLSRKDLSLNPEYRYVFQRHRKRILEAIENYNEYMQDREWALQGKYDAADQMMKSYASTVTSVKNIGDSDYREK